APGNSHTWQSRCEQSSQHTGPNPTSANSVAHSAAVHPQRGHLSVTARSGSGIIPPSPSVRGRSPQYEAPPLLPQLPPAVGRRIRDTPAVEHDELTVVRRQANG